MGGWTYNKKSSKHIDACVYGSTLKTSWVLLVLLAQGARQGAAAEGKTPSSLCQALPSLMHSVPVGGAYPTRLEQPPGPAEEEEKEEDFGRSGAPGVLPSESSVGSASSSSYSSSTLEETPTKVSPGRNDAQAQLASPKDRTVAPLASKALDAEDAPLERTLPSSASSSPSKHNNGGGGDHSEPVAPSPTSPRLNLKEDDSAGDSYAQQAPVGYFYYHEDNDDFSRGSRSSRSVGDALAPVESSALFSSLTSSPELNCSLADRLVAVQVRHHPRRRTATAGVFICPSVKLLRLEVIGGSGSHFIHVPAKVTLTSCARFNDTAVVKKEQHHRLHVILRFSVANPTSPTERLNYSYSLHPEPSKRIHKAPELSLPISEHRWKRAVKNQLSTLAPLLRNATNVNQDVVAVGTTTDCGKTRSCIRYGFLGCGHLTCDYMLSYHVINSTDVDMEISARDAGWVAVGFSSDRFMGGGDDVILCKRQRADPPVTTMSLGTSVKHAPPNEKENRLVLLDSRLHDRHIYCRVRRPLEFKKKVDDSDLDLFNDWHQLYAFGDVDGTGRIQQHTKKPWVSRNKITMVRVTDITVITNAASVPLMRSSSFLFSLPLLATVLTLTFMGS